MTAEFPDFDLYEELEISPRACPAVLRAAYRALSQLHHPDKAADKAEAETKMKRLNQAHDVLKDAGERARYDLRRAQSQQDRVSGTPPRSGGSAGRQRTNGTHEAAGLQCPRCRKVFKTSGGLQWHRANYRNCPQR